MITRKIRSYRQCGFTLIELVISLVVLSIISVVMYFILQGPVQMWVGLSDRAELTAAAEAALQRMSREIRRALPNSVRVSNDNQTIEFLRVIDGGRYRATAGTAGDDTLDFSSISDTFDILGGLDNVGAIDADAGASESDCLGGNTDCLVIFNTGLSGFNAYAGDNTAAITAVSNTSMTFSANNVFPGQSIERRFYVVDTPIQFNCSGGQIRRHFGYAISANISQGPNTGNVMTDHVTNCNFVWNTANFLNGIATFSITLTSDAGTTVTLMQQATVSNVP